MSRPAQRVRQAISDVEGTALGLLRFAETYSAAAPIPNNAGYHQSKRRELLELARQYGAAVRRLARLRP